MPAGFSKTQKWYCPRDPERDKGGFTKRKWAWRGLWRVNYAPPGLDSWCSLPIRKRVAKHDLRQHSHSLSMTKIVSGPLGYPVGTQITKAGAVFLP